MATRNLTLNVREEECREQMPVAVPVHFSPAQIKNHFVESMNGVKAQFTVADNLHINGNEEGCFTIWRSQVVLAEGLLDFYIHEVSKYCMFQMFCGNWNKSDKYANFMIPMSKVEEALGASESNEWFFAYLNDRFSREVFLSSESMSQQLNLIGIGFVPTMVKAFPRQKDEQSKKDGKKTVEELFKRRNEIAHQNDRSHASAQQTEITKEFVEDYITKVEAIVNAIQTIIEEKDSELER